MFENVNEEQSSTAIMSLFCEFKWLAVPYQGRYCQPQSRNKKNFNFVSTKVFFLSFFPRHTSPAHKIINITRVDRMEGKGWAGVEPIREREKSESSGMTTALYVMKLFSTLPLGAFSMKLPSHLERVKRRRKSWQRCAGWRLLCSRIIITAPHLINGLLTTAIIASLKANKLSLMQLSWISGFHRTSSLSLHRKENARYAIYSLAYSDLVLLFKASSHLSFMHRSFASIPMVTGCATTRIAVLNRILAFLDRAARSLKRTSFRLFTTSGFVSSPAN